MTTGKILCVITKAEKTSCYCDRCCIDRLINCFNKKQLELEKRIERLEEINEASQSK